MGTGALWDLIVRLGFYRVNEIREFMRVLNEEHRRVVADEIINAFVGIELGGPAANITHGVRRAARALYRGETDKYRGFLIRVGEEIRLGDISKAAIGLEIAVSRRAARVNDTLRDAFMVKMGNFLAQNKVFEQRRPARTRRQ